MTRYIEVIASRRDGAQVKIVRRNPAYSRPGELYAGAGQRRTRSRGDEFTDRHRLRKIDVVVVLRGAINN